MKLLEKIQIINRDKKDIVEKLKKSQFEIQEKNEKITNLTNINEQILNQIGELNTYADKLSIEKQNSELKNFWLHKNLIIQASSRNTIIAQIMSLIPSLSSKLKYYIS